MPTPSEQLIQQIKQQREDAAAATAAAASAVLALPPVNENDDVDDDDAAAGEMGDGAVGNENAAAAVAAMDMGVSAAAAAPAEASEEVQPPPPHSPPSPLPPSQHPKVALQMANQIKDKSSRERALLKALKDSRYELEGAEAANNRATSRLEAAKEVYNVCAQLLAGYTPLENRLSEMKKNRSAMGSSGTGNFSAGQAAKRIKLELGVDETTANATMMHSPTPPNTIMEVSAAVAAASAASSSPPILPRIKGQVQPEGENIILPTNEIDLPEYYTAGEGMDEQTVASHRDNFYLHLTKGESGAATIDNWMPPRNNANLKTKAQLSEWIHIATHWNTGADGLDAGAFRAKHKTWYSRMKPVTYNLGRRTGIHLRQLDMVGDGYDGSVVGENEDGKDMTVLCRYNKAGNKSIVYLDVGRLFDALFQIHAVELSHRGRDATKNLADERFANIPDATVRAFLETCPICCARKGHVHHHLGLPT